MPSDIILRHCSPTLAGIKIGNIFTYSFASLTALAKEIAIWNQRLNKKGVYFCCLRIRNKRALIYVFRMKQLIQRLNKANVAMFLENIGYDNLSLRESLNVLQNRLKNKKDFPHEIGVFLGYPLEDIQAFIKYKGENYKYIGCWKVYGDVQAAKVKFSRYDKCTKLLKKRYYQGIDITKLTVRI